MDNIKIKYESLSKRCEICHQEDFFDSINNICKRCNKYNKLQEINNNYQYNKKNTYNRLILKRNGKIFSFLVFTFITSLIFIVFPVYNTIIYFQRLKNEHDFITILFTILSTLLTGFFMNMYYQQFKTINRFYIQVYYSERVDDKNIDTFINGEEIYKNIKFINNICKSANVIQFTEFGFYDDIDGQKVIWHEPNDGLKTIKSIKKVLNSKYPQMGKLIIEIDKIEYGLNSALKKGIKFALLLRYVDSGCSGLEFDKRKGTFW